MAITDPDGRMALRHSTIDQKKENILGVVAQLMQEEGIEKVLVGVPISLSGEVTEQTHVSQSFIEQLRAALGAGVSVEGIDETLTSAEAARLIRAEGGKREDEHAEAARLMLVSYLTRISPDASL